MFQVYEGLSSGLVSSALIEVNLAKNLLHVDAVRFTKEYPLTDFLF